MFQTSVGAMSDAASVAYLRPETAQGIFTNFRNVVDTARVKVPFGIAQIGKAFRNEITPRNFIFRSREFEQMEIEYFVRGETWPEAHAEWQAKSMEWLVSIGLRPELLSFDVHAKDKLAHYAQACTDIEFQFPFGKQELQGVAARGNYDLTQHAAASGKSMEYFDDALKEKYVPHVIEPSIGVDRLMLAVLTSAYCTDEVGGEKRTVLKFHPRLAPIKVGPLPAAQGRCTDYLLRTAHYSLLTAHYLLLTTRYLLRTAHHSLYRWPSSRCSRTSPSWSPRPRSYTPSCSGGTTWPTTPWAPSAGGTAAWTRRARPSASPLTLTRSRATAPSPCASGTRRSSDASPSRSCSSTSRSRSRGRRGRRS